MWAQQVLSEVTLRIEVRSCFVTFASRYFLVE